jgi:hypothetical protein
MQSFFLHDGKPAFVHQSLQNKATNWLWSIAPFPLFERLFMMKKLVLTSSERVSNLWICGNGIRETNITFHKLLNVCIVSLCRKRKIVFDEMGRPT